MAEINTDKTTMHKVTVVARRWLSEHTFELWLRKPVGFVYRPGQKILCSNNQDKREYSLVSSPVEKDLAICVRRVSVGSFSSYLAEVKEGGELLISDGFGFFTHYKGDNVFVATGTGVAPFVSYAKSGVHGFILLHGVSSEKELYYRELFAGAAKSYIPCLTIGHTEIDGDSSYCGRVTEYLAKSLTTGKYNFYLCGNGAMIRDAIQIIDRRFPDSRVFHETFFFSER